MKRLILASLSTLVLTAVAAPQVRAIAPESSQNFVQQVINHNEELKQEQAQETRLQPEAVKQPMIKVKRIDLVSEDVAGTSIETPGFEYFERQYLDHHGS